MDNLINYSWSDEKYQYRADALDELLVDSVKNKRISTVTSTVLSVITCNMIMNDNVCKLSAREMAEKSGIHPKKIYTYINELIDINIIAKHKYKDKDLYYVNPRYIRHSRNITKTTLDLFGISYENAYKGIITNTQF